MLESKLFPFALVCVGMSTAAGFAAHWACPARSLSLLEGFLDAYSLKQLHVEMARKDETNVISHLRVRVNSYNEGDAALPQNISNFFGMTG